MLSVIKAVDMDDVLLEIVLGRLEKYPLADEATDLLLAAFESEESLSAQLSGEAAERPSADSACVVPPQPAGAYLQSLTVSGFRGIGQPATLRLQPGPGPGTRQSRKFRSSHVADAGGSVSAAMHAVSMRRI
jgi:hypothetical protein